MSEPEDGGWTLELANLGFLKEDGESEWHHVVATYHPRRIRKGYRRKLYIDGVRWRWWHAPRWIRRAIREYQTRLNIGR